LEPLLDECNQITAILTTIVKKIKEKNKKIEREIVIVTGRRGSIRNVSHFSLLTSQFILP